mmetsp:Transcript_14076/g.30566  ORF Transcript_14076/g.30566 Transcript_14076/m.30566 type:complete len:252 (-) Transcript_14076:57-812(-)
MNYNYDTEMDLRWEADQARRRKCLMLGIPDMPIRRITTGAKEATLAPADLDQTAASPSPRSRTSLGVALSALTINRGDPRHLGKVMQEILEILSDRNRISIHKEFVDLKGVDSILDIVSTEDGETLLYSLHVLDKLTRTCAREVCAGGAIEVLKRVSEKEGQAPQIISSALQALLGLSFDSECKALLIRHGVREVAQAVKESEPYDAKEVISAVPTEESLRAAEEDWYKVHLTAGRLLTRLGGPTKLTGRR